MKKKSPLEHSKNDHFSETEQNPIFKLKIRVIFDLILTLILTLIFGFKKMGFMSQEKEKLNFFVKKIISKCSRGEKCKFF